MPTRMPCTIAVRPMPRNTARVTSVRCCQRRARRRPSIGSMRTTLCASAGPSRSTKNSTNSISMKLTAVPSAPMTNVPPDDISDCEQALRALEQPALQLGERDRRIGVDPGQRPFEPRQVPEVDRQPLLAHALHLRLELAQQLRGLGGHRAGDRDDRQDEQQHREQQRDGAREPGAPAEAVGEAQVERREQRPEQQRPGERLPQRRDDAPDDVAERREQQHGAEPRVEALVRQALVGREGDGRFADVVRWLGHSVSASQLS